VHLHEHAHLLEPASSFSLLVESVGAMRLAYKALRISLSSDTIPNVFIDTTGCAFTYVPAAILFGCRVLAYVHYPTISTDMLQLVWERRRSTYNHQAYIAASAVTTYVKLIYYILFAVLYGAVGSLATLVLVNSTWTYNHIRSLWKIAAWRNRIRIVFPPCSLVDGSPGTNKHDQRQPVVLSIGQFRPEKDHTLQIESMARLLQLHPETMIQAKLVLIGSCRGAADEARLQQLQELCRKLQVTEHVVFVVNQPFSVIQEWLQKASVGIHTVRNR
jgi:alpha-1,2-mannosyltransferase